MASDASQEHVVTAAYSDGASAATIDVQVRLAHEGVAFHASRVAITVWPYNTLKAAEPISGHSDDILLSSQNQQDATLYISNSSFVRRLAERAPALTTFATRKREVMPWLWASVGVLALCAVVWAADLSPARAIANLLPDSARQKLGENIIASLSRNAKTCSTPEGDRALAKIKQRLLDHSDAAGEFSVVVLNWNVLNAFAAPGEQIILTRKLIETASGGDEIAGILAHEMGHGIELHPETGVVRAMGLTAAVQFLMGGGSSNAASFGILLAQLSYSRDAEREADAHAVRLMREAQISLKGVKGFFGRMNKKEKLKPGVLRRTVSFLRSHPVTEERLKQLEAAPGYDARPVLNPAEWQALKNICGKLKSKSKPKPKDTPKTKPDTGQAL